MGCGNESALACKELADFHGFPWRGCLEDGKTSTYQRLFPLLTVLVTGIVLPSSGSLRPLKLALVIFFFSFLLEFECVSWTAALSYQECELTARTVTNSMLIIPGTWCNRRLPARRIEDYSAVLELWRSGGGWGLVTSSACCAAGLLVLFWSDKKCLRHPLASRQWMERVRGVEWILDASCFPLLSMLGCILEYTLDRDPP